MVKDLQVNYSSNGKRLGIKSEKIGPQNTNVNFIDDVDDVINSATLQQTITKSEYQITSAWGLKCGIEDYCGVSLFNPIPQCGSTKSDSIYIDSTTQHIIIPSSDVRTIDFKVKRGATERTTGSMKFLINSVIYPKDINNGIVTSPTINIGATLTDRFKSEGSKEFNGVGYTNYVGACVYGEYTKSESTISGMNYVIESFPYVKGDGDMPDGEDEYGNKIDGCRSGNGIVNRTIVQGNYLEVPILKGPDELLKNKTNAVTFFINGVRYTRNTDENGYAKIQINLNPGVYWSKIFRGDTYYHIGDAIITVT